MKWRKPPGILRDKRIPIMLKDTFYKTVVMPVDYNGIRMRMFGR